MQVNLKRCPFTGEVPTTSLWTPDDGEHRDYARGAWIFFINSSLVEVAGASTSSEKEAFDKAVSRWNGRDQRNILNDIEEAVNLAIVSDEYREEHSGLLETLDIIDGVRGKWGYE